MKSLFPRVNMIDAPADTQRVIGASIFWWLLVLFFFSWIAYVMPVDKSPEFWRTIRKHDVSGAWMGVLVLSLSWVSRPLFTRVDWARAAAFIERRLVFLCGLGFLIYAALAYWPQQHFAFSLDEYCLLTQSRVFAAGQINNWMPPDLMEWAVLPRHIGMFFAASVKSGHSVPIYWPGLAILMTPFTFLGVPWLCNPLLGALALWGVHRLTLRISGSSETAAWAWLFTLASPVVALNAASFYAMPAHLLFNVFFCLLLLRGDWRGALGAGLVGGFALALHNPVPHLCFALPWLAFVAWKRRRLLLPLIAGYLVFAIPLGFGWSAYIGSFDPDQFASQVLVGNASSPFAEMLGRLSNTIQWPSLYIVLSRLGGLGKTVVWAVPGLLVLAWLGWSTLARKANATTQSETLALDRTAMRLLVASLTTTFLFYMMVQFDQTLGWGFRYIHQVWFVFPVLGAIFLTFSPQKTALQPFFAALCVLTLGLSLPLRAIQVGTLISDHRAQVPSVMPTVAAPVSITFIDIFQGVYTSTLVQNDAFLRNDDWHLEDNGTIANAKLARQYLNNPIRVKSGKWGEIWTGSALRHPPFPPPARQ